MPLATKSRELEFAVVGIDNLQENSMRPTPNGTVISHSIDVKTRCQGLVFDVPFKRVREVTVKLISTDLPDVEYYSLTGNNLQFILQEKYGNLASNENQNAIVPFSTIGNLPLSDDFYLKVDILLDSADILRYDRIISAFSAEGPIIVKEIQEPVKEVDSSHYDELYFTENTPDVNYILNGKNVHIPQLLLTNVRTIEGVSKIKLVNDTNYVFSAAVGGLFLVEFPNS